jgi:hypothetical protein
MRWFKMFADENETLESRTIIGQYGMAGYGRYVLLLEMMMKRVEDFSEAFALTQPNGDPIPLMIISEKLGYVHTKDCKKFLNFLAVLGVIDAEPWSSRMIVSKQDLRKRADNYTIKKKPSKRVRPMSVQCTSQEEEGEAEEEQKEKEKEKKNSNYTPKPRDVLEVIDYALTIELDKSDAEAFFDYYTCNGWKSGRHSMKDWHAALRNWKRRKADHEPHHNRNQRTLFPAAAPGSQQARATFHGTDADVEEILQALRS